MSPPKFLKPRLSTTSFELDQTAVSIVTIEGLILHLSDSCWAHAGLLPPVHVANPPRCSSTSCRSWCKPFNKILHVLKLAEGIQAFQEKLPVESEHFWPSLIQVHRHRSWIVHRRLIRASIVNHTVLPADSTGEGWGLTQGLWDNETFWKSW